MKKNMIVTTPPPEVGVLHSNTATGHIHTTIEAIANSNVTEMLEN